MKQFNYLFGFDFSSKTFTIKATNPTEAFGLALLMYPGQDFALLEEIK